MTPKTEFRAISLSLKRLEGKRARSLEFSVAMKLLFVELLNDGMKWPFTEFHQEVPLAFLCKDTKKGHQCQLLFLPFWLQTT